MQQDQGWCVGVWVIPEQEEKGKFGFDSCLVSMSTWLGADDRSRGTAMGVLTCVVVASKQNVRNTVAAALRSLGVEATLLASLEELPMTLENIPSCGVLLEVDTIINASLLGNKAIREMSEFYPFGKFKLVGNDVLILAKEVLDARSSAKA